MTSGHTKFYGPAWPLQNFSLCRLRPSQDSRAAHVPTHREGRKELGINGSSDLVDLETFREDSQIDFAQYGKRFLHVWGGGGGGLRNNVSQILAIINFFKQRNFRKNLVSKEEYYRQHNFKPNKSFKLEQIWRRQLHS